MIALDTAVRAETCGLLPSQCERRRDLDVEGERAFMFAQIERALLDIEMAMDLKQGLNVSDPAGCEIGEVERWIFDDYEFCWVPLEQPASAPGWYARVKLDGPCSLQTLCDNLGIEAGYIRRVVRAWRARREAGETIRLVPPQHP